MNCIIVDDDKFSTKVISDFIKRTVMLNLAGSFESAIDAVNFLSTKSIDVHLIFLDIEMPEMSGMDFLKSIETAYMQVVIYSSQEKYALESYEYNVADYLLKPVSYFRFIKAVNKVKAILEKPQESHEENAATSKNNEDEIFVKIGGVLRRIKYDEIIYLKAMENYIAMATYEKNHTLHYTMKEIITKLPSEKFIRVHRSYSVNTQKIKRICSNILVVDTADGELQIPIGKSYRDAIKCVLNTLSN